MVRLSSVIGGAGVSCAPLIALAALVVAPAAVQGRDIAPCIEDAMIVFDA
jgi:hypothetical protein